MRKIKQIVFFFHFPQKIVHIHVVIVKNCESENWKNKINKIYFSSILWVWVSAENSPSPSLFLSTCACTQVAHQSSSSREWREVLPAAAAAVVGKEAHCCKRGKEGWKKRETATHSCTSEYLLPHSTTYDLTPALK